MTITTVKACSDRKIIAEVNASASNLEDTIGQIDRKWHNTRIESGHAALKRIETMRMIKIGHISGKRQGVRGEVHSSNAHFAVAAGA